jgi:hypothetical protein
LSRLFVLCQFIGQQQPQHLVPGFVARRIALALGNQLLLIGNIFVDVTLQLTPHGNLPRTVERLVWSAQQ